MGASAPAPPDYTGAAEAAGESSRLVTEQQTAANRIDQYNPFGSVEYQSAPVYDPTTGETFNRWSQTQTLTPELQRALDAQIGLQTGRSELAEGLLGRVGGEIGPGMDWSRYGEIQGPVGPEAIDMADLPQGVQAITPGQYRDVQVDPNLSYAGIDELGAPTDFYDRAGDAMYERSAARLDPRFSQRRSDLDIQLRSQGLTPGDEAYDRAVGNLAREETDAYQAAQLDATRFAGAEGSRMFADALARREQATGEEQDIAQFYNQALGQQSAMDLATGGQRFSEQQAAAGFSNAARDQALREQAFIRDRAFTQENQAIQDANNARQAAIREEMTRRGFSLNEANALIAGQQVSLPQFADYNTASRAAPVDYLGAATQQYGAALDATNAFNADLGGFLGGAGSLAGGIAGFF